MCEAPCRRTVRDRGWIRFVARWRNVAVVRTHVGTTTDAIERQEYFVAIRQKRWVNRRRGRQTCLLITQYASTTTMEFSFSWRILGSRPPENWFLSYYLAVDTVFCRCLFACFRFLNNGVVKDLLVMSQIRRIITTRIGCLPSLLLRFPILAPHTLKVCLLVLALQSLF